jgi:DNA-binding NtrC family response regulator
VRFKVLFLDDEPEIVELFILNFTNSEVSISAFTDPEEAIRKTHQDSFDMIFLDYRMPTISGEEVAGKMPPEVPKYLMTGEISPKVAYPFAEILQKPFVDQRIAELIAEGIRRKIENL